MVNVKDKVVVITGASLGIGKSIAKRFISIGAKVVICSRTKSDLDKTIKEIEYECGFCDSMVVDVSVSNQVKKFVNYVIKKYGRLDVLVNCAGIYGSIGTLETIDFKLWEKTIKINLIGTVNSVRFVIPVMKKQRCGKIINMAGGGVGGTNIMPNFSAYITSKAAVMGFTEAMAKELKDFGIQVNAVSPGGVNTRLLDQVLEAGEAAGKYFLEKSKKQKVDGGTPPEKVVELVMFLASDSSCFITGKILSAVWDDFKLFSKTKAKIESTSLYTLRRIDNIVYYEK